MKTITVIAPCDAFYQNGKKCITKGKEYKGYDLDVFNFYIKDDYNDERCCRFVGCLWLNCLDWIIKKEPKPKKKVVVKPTSHEANNKKDKESDHKLILAVLTTIPSKAPTYGEIADILKWEAVRVARRMPELVELGKAKRMPSRKCKVRGTNCTTYLKIV